MLTKVDNTDSISAANTHELLYVIFNDKSYVQQLQ